jgi:hypothetical protein
MSQQKAKRESSPTSFRLSEEALEALETCTKLYRLNRTEMIEFLVAAASESGTKKLATEMAKLSIDVIRIPVAQDHR